MAAVFYLWWLGAPPRGKIERFSKASWEAAVAAGGKFPTWQAAVLAGDKFRPCVSKTAATTDEWCDRMFQRALLGIARALLLRLREAAPGSSGRLGAQGSGRPSGRPRHRLARSSPPLTTQELRGGLARYGALRLALGVGTYYDYTQPSSGSKPVEYRYFW